MKGRAINIQNTNEIHEIKSRFNTKYGNTWKITHNTENNVD
jgi:hypothetical protein